MLIGKQESGTEKEENVIYVDLSTSGAQSLRTCEQKFVYGEIERLQPRITSVNHNSPMEVGSWVHLGLAAHYSGRDWSDAIDELERIHDPFSANTYVQSISRKVRSLLESYFFHYTVVGKERGYEEFEVLAVEAPLTFDTIVTDTPTRLIVRTRATVDTICRDRNGELFILEHKTGAYFPVVPETALSESQVTLQMLAARANGFDVKYAVYNWIRSKEPTVPYVKKDGLISTKRIETDLRTFMKAVIDVYGEDSYYDEWPVDIQEKIEELSDPDNSLFFKRLLVTRSQRVELITLRDHVKTALRAAQLRLDPNDAVRVLNSYVCKGCTYLKVCMADLHNVNSDLIRLTEYEDRWDSREILER